MSASTKELVEKARFLRNAAPQQFDQFHKAFAFYAGDLTQNVIDATDNIQLSQGHAQLAMKLLGVFEEASK